MAELKFTSDSDYTVPTEAGQQFTFTDSSDFGPPTEPTRQYIIDKSKNLGFGFGTRRGLTKAGRGLEEAYLKLFGSPKEQEDLQKIINMENARWADLTGEWNPETSGRLKWGEVAGQVLPALALPTPQSKSMAMRAMLNAMGAGAYEGATTTGTIGDRAASAGIGALGGGLGSIGGDLVTKGWNMLRGAYSDLAAVKLGESLRKIGLKPRIGDIVDPETGVMLKSGENLLAETPMGAGAIERDIESLRRKIVPDRVSGENVVAEAVRETEKGVQQRADDIWNPFKTFVSQNQVPGVRPVNLQKGLREILKYDKTFLSDIKDDVLRGKLETLIQAKPNQLKAIPADEYVELNSALSGLTPYIKARAQPAPGSTALSDKQSYKRFAENIMEGMNQDWQVWKSYKSPNAKQAGELLDKAQKSWKKEILPWKRSDLAYKLGQIEQHGASETARLISGEADIDAASMVREYLKKYGPYDSELPVDALMAMRRQGQALGSGTEKVSGLDISRGVFGAPLASVSRKPGVQKFYLAKPQAQGPLMEAFKRGIIGTGRESGTDLAVGSLILDSLLRGTKEGDAALAGGPEDIHNVGSATQMGVR